MDTGIRSAIGRRLIILPVDPQSIEENQRYIASETKKWGDLIRKPGLGGISVKNQ